VLFPCPLNCLCRAAASVVVHNKWRLMQLFFKKNNLIAKLIVEREIIIEEIERADREMKVG
jgi:hypothetical protein